jgi:hypothetical protein
MNWLLMSAIAFSLLVWGLVGAGVQHARGADYICTPAQTEAGECLPLIDRPGIRAFGTYSDHYYQRRWARLCKGAGRYDAMREAYDLGKPDPCNGAVEWRR